MARRFFLFACLLLLAPVSCSEPTTPAAVLYFVEHEPGAEPYRTRMLVTAGFLRMDGGADDVDFLLFDRADGTLYSVTAADRQILVIPPRRMDAKSPADLTHKVIRDSAAFPAVGAHKVSHYELLTNGKRCYDLYAAAELMPEAVAALRQYREVLAGQQAKTLSMMPPEMQSACDLANNVFLPARHLEHGFPVRLTDMTGKTLELVDYNTEFRATAALLRLPADYKRLTIGELRGNGEK
ncbi:MAG: hypothetical protein Tsb0026_01610 [Sulfuricaulis sp.]